MTDLSGENRERKIFIVKGMYSNSTMSRMVNYGDNYGERYEFTEYVVSTNPKNAITHVERAFKKKVKRHNRAVDRMKKIRKEKGREPFVSEKMMFGPGPFPPSWPKDVEKWKVEELNVPGYKIIVERT